MAVDSVVGEGGRRGDERDAAGGERVAAGEGSADGGRGAVGDGVAGAAEVDRKKSYSHRR